MTPAEDAYAIEDAYARMAALMNVIAATGTDETRSALHRLYDEVDFVVGKLREMNAAAQAEVDELLGFTAVDLDVEAVRAEWCAFFPGHTQEFEGQTVRAWVYRIGRPTVMKALGITQGRFVSSDPQLPGGHFRYFVAVMLGIERERGAALAEVS